MDILKTPSEPIKKTIRRSGLEIKEAEEQGADWLEQNRRAMNAVLEKYPYTSQIDAARLISKLNR